MTFVLFGVLIFIFFLLFLPSFQGIKPPPASFQNNWYASYYNSLKPNEMQEAQAWFRAIDTDRSGEITASEIQRCTFGGKPLGFDTAAKLVRVFDKNFSGSIDFYEYAALHKFLSLMQHSFFAGDTDRSGRLDAREIHTALGTSMMQVPMNVVQVLFNKFNKDGYGLSFPDFLLLGCHIASAKSAFAWEHQAQGNRGTITVDLNKFLELSGRV